MKRKRLYVILIVAVLCAAFVLSFTCLFTVRFSEVKFQAVSGENSNAVSERVAEYNGRNLLFLDTDEVANSLSDFYGYKVVSVEKKFPNKLTVNIEERKEVFAINVGEKTLITDESGFIIRSEESFSPRRDIVYIESSGLVFNAVDNGQTVSCNDDELFFTVMSMAKKINYYNCISKIVIEKATEKRFAYFETYTGVVLEIPDAHIRGTEKIEVAFNEYDNCENDYVKSFNTITVSIQSDGSIKATWVKNRS